MKLTYFYFLNFFILFFYSALSIGVADPDPAISFQIGLDPEFASLAQI
jgi:hypothetical protein